MEWATLGHVPSLLFPWDEGQKNQHISSSWLKGADGKSIRETPVFTLTKAPRKNINFFPSKIHTMTVEFSLSPALWWKCFSLHSCAQTEISTVLFWLINEDFFPLQVTGYLWPMFYVQLGIFFHSTYSILNRILYYSLSYRKALPFTW